jgi:hypothetical protein
MGYLYWPFQSLEKQELKLGPSLKPCNNSENLIETIIYKSAPKMKELSRNGDIDYVLIKAK